MKNLLIALFLLASVVVAEEPKTLEIELGKPFLLSVLTYSDNLGAHSVWSDTGTFEDLNLTIKTVEDSRCPEGEGDVVISCYVEGEAKVTVSLEGGDNFVLVKPRAIETEQDSVVFDGYKLTLMDVTPFPTIEEPATRFVEKTVHLLLEKTP
jgi:hypothetical protein